MARAVARRLAGDHAFRDSYLIASLERDLSVAVPRAEELVAEVSGIPAPPPVEWGLVDRGAWADANIDGLVSLLAPLAERIGDRLDQAPVGVRLAQRGVVSVEVGALLGYVSRRVLGQYDVLVPEVAGERPARTAPLMFVGPNLVETERRFSFVPQDFSLWIAVHEVTHRFQFSGVPWLKDRFMSLVSSYLDGVELDARHFAGRVRRAALRLRSGALPTEERNPVYLLASDAERARLDELQALMAVVEGHGNYVMDAVGAGAIPTFARMRRTFEHRRRHQTSLQRAIHHVIGLEMKLRQYEMGQGFCDGVVALEGPEALHALWARPENLPSLSELKEPTHWLRRVA
ncbi:zinc-dependent metalloprotease [soil metagenome]